MAATVVVATCIAQFFSAWILWSIAAVIVYVSYQLMVYVLLLGHYPLGRRALDVCGTVLWLSTVLLLVGYAFPYVLSNFHLGIGLHWLFPRGLYTIFMLLACSVAVITCQSMFWGHNNDLLIRIRYQCMSTHRVRYCLSALVALLHILWRSVTLAFYCLCGIPVLIGALRLVGTMVFVGCLWEDEYEIPLQEPVLLLLPWLMVAAGMQKLPSRLADSCPIAIEPETLQAQADARRVHSSRIWYQLIPMIAAWKASANPTVGPYPYRHSMVHLLPTILQMMGTVPPPTRPDDGKETPLIPPMELLTAMYETPVKALLQSTPPARCPERICFADAYIDRVTTSPPIEQYALSCLLL